MEIAKNNTKIDKLYGEVLCRSYATYNKEVKMCKGRPGYDCKRCFSI